MLIHNSIRLLLLRLDSQRFQDPLIHIPGRCGGQLLPGLLIRAHIHVEHITYMVITTTLNTSS